MSVVLCFMEKTEALGKEIKKKELAQRDDISCKEETPSKRVKVEIKN